MKIPPPRNFQYSKNESLMVGALAVILMVFMHLFGHPEWYSDGVGWNSYLGPLGNGFTKVIARSGGICVQIFALMSGYALFINPGSFDSFNKRIIRIIKFLSSYWIIYFLFLFIGFLNDVPLPSLKDFIFNFFTININDNHNMSVIFGWYVTFYVEFLLFAPLIPKIFNKNNNIRKTLIMLAGFLIFTYILICNPFSGVLNTIFFRFNPILYVVLGFLCAKYQILHRIHNLLSKVPIILCPILFLFLFLFRYELTELNKVGGHNWQYFIIVVDGVVGLILFSILVEIVNQIRSIKIKKTLCFIGSVGLYIWLSHSIFFTGNNLFQKELYQIKEPILILLGCLLIITPMAYIIKKLVDSFWKNLKFQPKKKTVKLIS